MNRIILLALAVCCSCASVTIADDYLVRLDTIGHAERPVAEDDSKEAVLHRIEVVARSQSPFHAKVRMGMQTLVLAGKLSPDDSGDFRVQFRYVHSVDTGTTAPSKDGGQTPVINTSAMQTSLVIAVGDTVTLGEFERRQSGKVEHTSKSRVVLSFTKYEPSDDWEEFRR